MEVYDLSVELASKVASHENKLRLLILSSASVEDSEQAGTIARIAHLSALDSGGTTGIAFLLSSTDDPVHDSDCGLQAFLKLQLA